MGPRAQEGGPHRHRRRHGRGVTTALAMPTYQPPTFTADEFAAERALAEGKLHVDIGLQAAATGPEDVSALAE